ncbi:nitroreductase family protein [Telluribacter sp.]|jgi:nitroreductase|uniref:nitroreductase family protein n=1 Tax=Telluribacter sp. TaxID=1978767 RepID=UPI002E0EDC8F|nr:nitroreductase family protein [Telluribacter sp.]
MYKNADEPYKAIPFEAAGLPEDEVRSRSREYHEGMEKRRSLRFFSDRPVPRDIIEQLIMTGSSAPSGANKQPWTFCAVSSPAFKQQIRQAAEEEEYRSYHGRMSEEWLRDLAPLGTDWRKPFLETAPWLVIIFRKIYDLDENGHKHTNYYVQESVGLAAGFFLTAVHQAGLVALTHTPSPMDFLTRLLGRPAHEKPFLLIPVGYPAPDATVPDIQRKSADEVTVWYE